MPTRLGPPPAYWPQGFFAPAVPGPAMGASAVGTPILTQQFADLRLVVEFAWGAPASVDPTAYPWTDVTRDVLANNKVTITPGRANEASTTQPATCSFRLKNFSGDYSKGPQSRNYPNVKKGVPVRVRTILNGISYTRFFGYANAFKPGWDTTGKFAYVDVTAAGSLRRLNQGTDPLQSALRRSVPGVSSVVAYWPCEDGSLATQFVSGLSGAPAMSISGTPSPASFSGYMASSPIPTFQADTWTGVVPAYSDTGSAGVTFLMAVPASTPMADSTRLMSINTSGGISRIDLFYRTGGQLQVKLFGPNSNTAIGDSGSTLLGASVAGQLLRTTITWTPDGSGGMNVFFAIMAVGSTSTPIGLANAASVSITGIRSVVVAPDGTAGGTAIGHIYAQNLLVNLLTLYTQFNAYIGESPTTRLARLCAEQGELVNVVGSSAQAMGPQLPNSFINLLRECETADGGILYDGANAGLTYAYRETAENRAADITLNAAIGDAADPVEPYDDDLLTLNTFTATRLNGSTFTVSDTADALAVAAVGDYSSSDTVNCQYDSQAQDYASWQVHLGTQDADYRYPTLNLAFHRNFGLLPGWLNVALRNRLDVVNLSSVRTQQDTKTISVLLEGYTETIDKFTWFATANCSPYDPWRIGTLAADTGDNGEFLMRLDSDGSTVVLDAPAGSTSLSVATPSGPLWTTAADDCPMTLNINDTPVVVTAISGSSSPQTFTVQSTARHIAPGAQIAFWHEPVLEL